jgi:hypothetical protein
MLPAPAAAVATIELNSYPPLMLCSLMLLLQEKSRKNKPASAVAQVRDQVHEIRDGRSPQLITRKLPVFK